MVHHKYLLLEYSKAGGTWVAQSVKHLTLDFGSGHDLMVYDIKPHIGLCADSVEPAWDSLSPCLFSPSATHPPAYALSQNK